MFFGKVYIKLVYIQIKLVATERLYLSNMLKSFYDMIEDQKIYYSNPICRVFD